MTAKKRQSTDGMFATDLLKVKQLLGDLYFRVFLGWTTADPTPDQKMIWFIPDCLHQSGAIIDLSDAFDE